MLTTDQKKFYDSALSMGAVNVQVFTPQELVFDPRTLIKCMFGCGDWGKGHTCPSRPGNISLEQWRETLMRYRWGLIVHSHDPKLNQDIVYGIEQQAFVCGFYFAFSMSDCKLCASCAGHEEKPCRFPKKARPAFHSVGIDIFATARRFKLPIEALADTATVQNWYAAVFIE